jgi:hypothetical protein
MRGAPGVNFEDDLIDLRYSFVKKKFGSELYENDSDSEGIFTGFDDETDDQRNVVQLRDLLLQEILAASLDQDLSVMLSKL